MIFKSWPILAGGLLIAAAVFAGFMSTSASARSNLTAQRSCSETSDFLAQSGNQANWAEADWTTNSCGWYIRGFAHCESGRNFILYTGGWITSVNKESRASCTTGYPVLAGGGYDFKQCSTCSYTRVWKTGHIRLDAFIAHRCQGSWDPAVSQGVGTDAFAQGDWEVNTCPADDGDGYVMEIRAHCINLRYQLQNNFYSGRVESDETIDRATCNGEYPTLDQAAMKYEYAPGLWTAYTVFWTR